MNKVTGSFLDHAELSQDLKSIYHSATVWDDMSADQKEALDMVANSIAALLNGNFSQVSNWENIMYYSQLVTDRLRKEEDAIKVKQTL